MFKWYPYLASTVTLLCVACGASFSANEGGTAAVAGSSGDSNGGSEASAGSSSVGDAGQVETGGSAAGGESSTAGAGGSPIGGCGCPVLINAKSEYAVAAKKAYQADQNNKCDLGGPVCDAFCAPPTAASCAQQSMGSGNSFVCTAAGIIQN
jgi:hypothetical protein